MAVRRNLAAGAALATAAQLTNAVTGGVTGVIVARLLGPEGTGAFTVLLSMILLVAAASSLGVEIGASYRVSNGRWAASDALRQCQFAAGGLGLLGLLGGGLLAFLTSGSAFQDIRALHIGLALLAVPASLSWTYVGAVVLALERYAAYAIAISSQGLSLLFFVAVLTPLFDMTGAVIGLLASNAVPALGLFFWTRRRVDRPEAGWVRRTPAALWHASTFGVRAYATNVLSYLNQRADLFILNAVAMSAVVGHYAIALTITSLGLLLPRALSAVTLPRIAALDAHRGATDTAARSARHGVLLALASTLLLAMALPFIPLIYGPDFGPAVALGYILLPGVALFGIGSILAATIVGKGRPEYSLYTVLIVTPPTIGLYVVLTPVLGAEGAALASTVSYASTFGLLLMYFRRLSPALTMRDLAPGGPELADYRLLMANALRRLKGRNA